MRPDPDDPGCAWCGLAACTTPSECDAELERLALEDEALEDEANSAAERADLAGGDFTPDDPEAECPTCDGRGGGIVGEDEVTCTACGGTGYVRAWPLDEDDDPGFSPPDPDDRPEWSDADQTRWENANIYEPKGR